jgi:hypothetical protein
MRICAVVVGVLLSLTPASASLALAPPACASPQCRAAQELHRWDRSRAQAFVAADPAALARLYETGSLAGRRDLALLERYVGAGVRITMMTTQVFSLRIRVVARDRVVVDLVDRVAASGDDGVRCLRLPSSAPRPHQVELRHRDGNWVVAAVRRPPSVA